MMKDVIRNIPIVPIKVFNGKNVIKNVMPYATKHNFYKIKIKNIIYNIIIELSFSYS